MDGIYLLLFGLVTYILLIAIPNVFERRHAGSH